MSKARVRVAGMTAFLLAAAVLIGLRACQVNEQALRIETEHYSMGEWVDLSGTILDSASSEFPGYSIKINSAEVVSYNDFIKRHGKNKDRIEAGLDEKSVVDLEFEIRNRGNDKGGIPLMSMLLIPDRKNTYYIWNDKLWVESEPNSQDALFLAIKSDSEYLTHLPYTRNIFDSDMTAFKASIGDERFELVVANAPVKKVIDIASS